MASKKVGNKPLKKEAAKSKSTTLHCLCCNDEYNASAFYSSDSRLHKAIGKLPYCKECLDEFYHYYLDKYQKLKYKKPERKAVEKLCMLFDIYYSDKVFEDVTREAVTKSNGTLFSLYVQRIKLYQYRKKDYDTTIHEKFLATQSSDAVMSLHDERDFKQDETIKEAIKFFGTGFSDDDYIFLQEQYMDWTTRHECQTKAQEEVFKRICFKQLEILKATRNGDDTKDLDMTFQKLLETAKLQPKQNSGETMSDAQTFGTLIDKWENTRPLPEIDEELRDVDKIGLYLDIFFKGHLSKMMGLKNGLSNLYTKFMKQYTVEKPEYNDDENSEVLFDAIFGGQTSNEEVV